MAAKKKTAKPRPRMLGTGIASKGGKILSVRQQQIECQTLGGKWKNGRCVK